MTHVLVPNKLVESSHNLSLLGLRLRTIAISRLTPLNYVFGYAPPIAITAQDWLAAFPESEQPYRDLVRALESLDNAKVEFPPYQEEQRFLANAEYLRGEGKVILQFCPMFLKRCL